MAKSSAIQKNLKRIRLVKKFLKKRESLKKIIRNKKLFWGSQKLWMYWF